MLAGLANDTGGRVIQTADEAFVHDLPAVGAPRPIWPYLLVLLAIVLVGDVGVRRLRLSMFEVRSGYWAMLSRLASRDDLPVRSARPATGAPATMWPVLSAATATHTPKLATARPEPTTFLS
jgi:hypothetical protein